MIILGLGSNLKSTYGDRFKNLSLALSYLKSHKIQILLKIHFPFALPYLLSGIKIASVSSIIGAVIGEWVGSSEGLGYLMIRSKPQFLTELVFASIFILSTIGIGLFLLVGILERLIIPWSRFENSKD